MDCGFTDLALCAREYQPNAAMFPGIHVIRCPISDLEEVIPGNDMAIVKRSALAVAHAMAHGGDVLVTCWEGRNRSSFVGALALLMITNLRPEQIIRRIRMARKNALTNELFVSVILDGLLPLRSYGAPPDE